MSQKPRKTKSNPGLIIALLTLSVLLVSWLHFAGSPTAQAVKSDTTQPAAPGKPVVNLSKITNQWSDWTESYHGSAETGRDDLLEQGIALARERRAAMLELIQSDPQAALAAAMPRAERELLPRAIQDEFETIISARAPLDVVQTCFHPDEPDKCTHDHEVYRSTFIDGQSYFVHVYGSRLNDLSIPHSSLHGIAIDGHLAVSESRVRVLDGEETRLAGVLLPTPDAIAVEANGEVTVLPSSDELAAFEASILEGEDNPTYIAADANDGVSTVSMRPNQAHASGAKKLLVVLVDFSDLPGRPLNKSAGNAPITEDAVNNLINGPNGVREFFQESSFGKTDIILAPTVNGDSPDITEVLRMPYTASDYANNRNSSQLQGNAIAAAAAAGYATTTYDRICVVFSNLSNFDGGTLFNGWAGNAGVGGQRSNYNGYWDFRVVAHELGHNWGLWHANLWKVTDGDPGSLSGSSQAYGNSYDTMGAAAGSHLKHFSPWSKTLLWWIPDAAVPAATTSGTYRVHRFDHGDANLALPRALKIVRNETRDYWIGYRRTDPNASTYNGAYVQWGYNSGRTEPDLLDMNTPGSNINDAALSMNQTFTDSSGGIEFTPVAQGGSGGDEWIDIQVQFYDPVVQFASSSYSVNQDGGSVTLTVNRVQSSLGTVSVNYATSPGTATAPADYTTTTGTLTWSEGDMSPRTIEVPIIATGPGNEPDETFTVSLSSPVGADLGSPASTTVTITGISNTLPVVNAGNDQSVSLTGTYWSPLELTPQLWLDADDASTITLNGNTVSQWGDKSGFNRHATQAAATNQPALVAGGLNGKSVMSLDGANDFFEVDLNFLAGNSHSAFIVTKPTVYSNIYGAANGGSGSNSLHVGFLSSSRYRINYWGNDYQPNITSNLVAGAANILNYNWITGTGKEIFTNGKSEGANTVAGTIGTMSGGGRIGHTTIGTHGAYGGDIAEFIILTGTVDPADRELAEGYLAHKWGLTNHLAATHPYKSVNPNDAQTQYNLQATATDADGQPLTYSWSLVSGPGSVTFSDASALDTTINFSAPGVYTLRLTVSDGLATVTDDVVITVDPPAAGYTVTYAGNGSTGGSVPIDASNYPAGSTVTVFGNTGSLTRTGYSFGGWNTAANGSGTSYTPGSTFNISADTTLHAQWTPDPVPPIVDAGADQSIELTGTSQSQPTAGASIFLDAGLDDGADNIWQDAFGNWSPTIDTSNVAFLADAGSALPGIVSAYDFPGGLSGVGGCEGPSMTSLGADTKPITLEIWFKPDASASYPSNGQVLWETGGGIGIGIFYRNGFVETAHDSNASQMSADVSSLTNEYIQVVVTYDTTSSTDSYKLYINGELKASADRNDGDICGSDLAGLGERGGSNVGGAGSGDSSTTSFDGKIAIFRSYHDRILTAAEVSQNYQSIAGGASAQATLAGTATDPLGLPLTTQWSLVSGPGQVDFEDPSNPDTTATFTLAGVYTLRLTADNGTLDSSDEVVITVNNTVSVTHNVTYDGNGNTGGSVPVDAGNPYDEGSTVTVLGNTGSLVRTGHSFNGWNTASDGSGTSYTAGNTFTISADTTLYAQWTPNPIAVVTNVDSLNVTEGATTTFQVKLSDQPAANTTVTVSRTSGDADITVQSGGTLTFTTGNWNSYQTVTLAAAEDADVSNGSATITCDPGNPAHTAREVTAVEVDNDTTLTVASGGNGDTSPAGQVIVEKSTATAISATAAEGYDFASWTVTSGSATIADPNAAATTATISAPATVQANFTPRTYLVTYNGNGSDGGSPPAGQTKIHGENLTLAGNTGSLVKTGFSFGGWNTASDGSGTTYPASGTYTDNAPITLYAKWDSGADGTWLATLAGPFNWSDPANWSNGVIASGIDSTAFFTPNLTANQVAHLDSARSIGNITFTDSTTASHDLTISGANTLTLARTTGVPAIHVSQSTRTLAIATPLAGASGFTKSGAGALTLAGDNSNLSGTTTLSAGTLNLNSATALGTGDFNLNNGGTIDNTSGAPVTLSTDNAITANSFTFGGTHDLDLGTGGVWMGYGDRSITLNGTDSTLSMAGKLSLYRANSSAGMKLTVNGAGNTLLLGSLEIGAAGTNITIQGDADVTVTGATTESINTNKALIKDGTGTLTLHGAYTSDSLTRVNGGTLLINGDASAATGLFTVNTNGILGGTGTIGADTTIADGGGLVFDISTPAASHDELELATGKALTFSGGSVLTITSGGGAQPGTYTLVTAPGGISGSAPATLHLPVNWAGTVSISGNSLVLNLTSTGGGNSAPEWDNNPVAGADAAEDGNYASTLANHASDPDSDPLTFAKVSGPAWLSVAANGDLSGTPNYQDVGTNSFTVSVSDGTAAPVEATLEITVVATTTLVPDVVGLPQAGAESSLAAATLAVGTVTQEYSATVPAGDVISQGLAGGSRVPLNSGVDLVVSLGSNASPKLVRTTVNAVNNTNWTTVGLGQTYNSPVIVATPIYPPGFTTPVVTRVTNVTGTGFDLRIDRADGQTAPVSIDVSVVVVDEGVYTQAADGVTMEAVKFTSTITARNGSWVAEARSFQNSYTNPVVVGQVMSANDANWSVFWSMGSSATNPVDASNLNVGKHVAEDPNTTRADETIGYIVIESGTGTINGVPYVAGVGSDTVMGLTNSATPYNYSLGGSLASASAAAVSQAGMDGIDGSWAVLAGSQPITPTSISIYAAEDTLKDTEQNHTTEQVGYIVFE